MNGGSTTCCVALDLQHHIEQIVKQLFKLIDVVRITELDPRKSVERELMLATVRIDGEQRGQVVELANVFEAKVLAVGNDAMSLSMDGTPEKLDDFEELLKGYGIVESQRTGRVALPKLEREARKGALKGKAS
jgi:acetolactate synthase-1/3 small subunit